MNNIIMCIGNRHGGDDAAVAYVYDKLKNWKHDDFIILDCGTVPENFTSVVKKQKPQRLILIDAVDMNLDPGEIRIMPMEKNCKRAMSDELFGTEKAYQLVKKGAPFREAYKEVSKSYE